MGMGNSTVPTAGSAQIARRHAAEAWGLRRMSAVVSTGLSMLAKSGSSLRRAALVSGANTVIGSPAAPAMSAASAAVPPEKV
ncbi:hypothetical protein D3C86_1655480 [compost metagenome]